MPEMLALRAHNLDTLAWVQTATWARRFELRSGDGLAGSLDFQNAFGSLAEATTASGRWTFKRTGFFHPRVTVRVAGSDADVATYTPNWSSTKGTLVLADGGVCLLRTTSIWASSWTWTTQDGTTLVEFRNHGVFRHGAEVIVAAGARERSELPLLLTLGWYLLHLYQEDSSAAATIVVTS